MYRFENSVSREGRFRHERESPSFSSTLLDKIYRSIDDEKSSDDLKFFGETMAKKQSSNSNSNRGAKKEEENEKMESFRRACLIEKWAVTQRRREQERNHYSDMNDALFFSSTSSSSDSSSGGFSSSDSESMFGAARSASSSSHSAPPAWPKPVRTTVTEKKQRNSGSFYEPNDAVDNETLIKSKSRALKMYNNLKKVKQPISPGGRLASFINNLFASSGNAKKPSSSKAAKTSSFQEPSTTTCSSASSFSRSCLSKSSPSTRERLRSTSGVKRSVRFYPVSVIVDEDSRPCGHKSLHEEQESVLIPVSVPTAWKIGRSPARKAEEAELKARPNSEKTRRVEETAREFLRDYRQNQIKNELIIMRDQFRGKDSDAHEHVDHDHDHDNDNDEEDDDDSASYSSSDLFELDHLAVIGKEVRYQEELPVYETTRVDRNRAITNGLIM